MNQLTLLNLVPDAVCVAVCLGAALTDLKTRRIPNRLTFPAIGTGLLLSWVLASYSFGALRGLTEGLLPSAAGGTALFAVFLLLALGKGMGMGDVKLMAAVGTFLRWPHALYGLGFTLLAGAILGFLYALRTGSLKAVFANMGSGIRQLGRKTENTKPLTLHHMPYGLAIFIGVSAAVAHRYWRLF